MRERAKLKPKLVAPLPNEDSAFDAFARKWDSTFFDAPFAVPMPHKPRSARPRKNAERQIQRAVFQHIRHRGAPGVFAFHPMNGGIHQRGARRAAINAMMGVKAGVPDVCILHKGAFYGLELKAENGRATEKQMEAVANIRNAGGFACICYGLDRALQTLKTWGIIR